MIRSIKPCHLLFVIIAALLVATPRAIHAGNVRFHGSQTVESTIVVIGIYDQIPRAYRTTLHVTPEPRQLLLVGVGVLGIRWIFRIRNSRHNDSTATSCLLLQSP